MCQVTAVERAVKEFYKKIASCRGGATCTQADTERGDEPPVKNLAVGRRAQKGNTGKSPGKRQRETA
jgi:hypothetical protein